MNMRDIKDYEDRVKLDLPESERTFVSEFAGMLSESFKELEKINTEGILPLVTVLEDVFNVFREDEAKKLLSRDELMSGAPEAHDGYFSVPKTLV